MKRSELMTRWFLFVFLALAIGTTFLSRESFFASPTYAESDHAANALQIEHARHFQELHGNYSRWDFHHPGPAFFYVAALGEWVLCDLTHLAPAPHNAHLYTNAMLQLAFYAAALALIARRSRQPVVFVAVALAVAALHFPHVERAFYGIWPPDVLLMPLLCFIVACAAVATGDIVALPFLVIAGGFLIHGHIALPLFVIPLSAVALGWAWRDQWHGTLRTIRRSVPGRISLALAVLFALPLVLDLFAGRESNAFDVLLHVRFNSTAGQSAWQAFLFYASYFVGLRDPSCFNRLTPEVYAVFKDQAWLLAFWVALLAGASIRFFRGGGTATPSGADRFGRRLLVFWVGASLLTVIWGMRQDGGFTFYNSHFNHALVHLVALAAILAAIEWLPTLPAVVTIPGAAAALGAFLIALPYLFEIRKAGIDVNVRLPAILAVDPKPLAPKLLVFESDQWGATVTLASALEQRGIPFYVSPRSRFMFGRDVVFNNQNDVMSHGGVSVWDIIPRQQVRAGAHVLDEESAVVLKPADAAQFPLAIDFRQRGPRGVIFGIGGPEPGEDFAWTDGYVAVLTLAMPTTPGDVVLTLDASGLTSRSLRQGQRLTVRVNGTTIGAENVSKRRILRFSIPAAVWNSRSTQVLILEFPSAISPSADFGSGDRRILALRMYSLSLTESSTRAIARQ